MKKPKPPWECPVFNTQELERFVFEILVRQCCVAKRSKVPYLNFLERHAVDLGWLDKEQPLPRTEEFISDLWTNILEATAAEITRVSIKLVTQPFRAAELYVAYIVRQPPYRTVNNRFGYMKELNEFDDCRVPDLFALQLIQRAPYARMHSPFRDLCVQAFRAEGRVNGPEQWPRYYEVAPRMFAPAYTLYDLVNVLLLPYITPEGRQNLDHVYSELIRVWSWWFDAQYARPNDMQHPGPA